MIDGGAIFLEPERKEETEKALDASCNEGEELEESIELMLAGYKKLEEPIHSNGMQTEGSIFKHMNRRDAREMVRNALKNATTLHPEKEKAIKILKELGTDMNENNCKRWRHEIAQLYKEELDAYKIAHDCNSIKDNKIRIRMRLDAASIDARDRQDVDDAADGGAADCANAAANTVNVVRLDAASIDARDRQDVDDAAEGGAADCANAAANAVNVAETLVQMYSQGQARVFKPIQQETANFDEIAITCSHRRSNKRKFMEYGDKSEGTEVA